MQPTYLTTQQVLYQGYNQISFQTTSRRFPFPAASKGPWPEKVGATGASAGHLSGHALDGRCATTKRADLPQQHAPAASPWEVTDGAQTRRDPVGQKTCPGLGPDISWQSG
jgi:hypothetical protein